MVISWERSPSSARKTTPRLSRVAASIGGHLSTRRRRPNRRTPVEGLAHRSVRTVRRPGYPPVCRRDDSGLLPFANDLRLTGKCRTRQERVKVRATVFVDSDGKLIGMNFVMPQAAWPELPCPDG